MGIGRNHDGLTLLAHSPGYLLGHRYESVEVLPRSGGEPFGAGDHWGDPRQGLITPDEAWFVTLGEGIQCFSLAQGLHSFFRRGTQPHAPQEVLDAWDMHSIELVSSSMVQIRVDHRGVSTTFWRLDLGAMSLQKHLECPYLGWIVPDSP